MSPRRVAEELSHKDHVQCWRWMLTFVTLNLACSQYWSETGDRNRWLAVFEGVCVGKYRHQNLSWIWLSGWNKSCLQTLPRLCFSARRWLRISEAAGSCQVRGKSESALVKRSCVKWDYLLPASIWKGEKTRGTFSSLSCQQKIKTPSRSVVKLA